MPDNTDFLQKIRMNNIFPAPGGTPFNMPDLNRGRFDSGMTNSLINTILNEKQKDRDLQLELAGMRGQGNLRNIAQAAQQPATQQQPMNTVWGYDSFKNQMTPYQKESLGLQKMGLEQKGRLGEEGLDVRRGQLGINQQRADVYEFKARNPNMKPIFTKGGNVMFYHPDTGEMVDSGVATGTLSEKDKLTLTGQQRMEQIGARGSEQEKLLGMRGTEQEKLQGMRGEQNLAAIAARSAGKGEKALNPSQIRTSQMNTAREIVNTRPDLSKFIKFDEKGNAQNVAEPGSPEYEEINKKLYNPAKDIVLPSESKSTPKTEKKDSLGIR